MSTSVTDMKHEEEQRQPQVTYTDHQPVVVAAPTPNYANPTTLGTSTPNQTDGRLLLARDDDTQCRSRDYWCARRTLPQYARGTSLRRRRIGNVDLGYLVLSARCDVCHNSFWNVGRHLWRVLTGGTACSTFRSVSSSTPPRGLVQDIPPYRITTMHSACTSSHGFVSPSSCSPSLGASMSVLPSCVSSSHGLAHVSLPRRLLLPLPLHRLHVLQCSHHKSWR